MPFYLHDEPRRLRTPLLARHQMTRARPCRFRSHLYPRKTGAYNILRFTSVTVPIACRARAVVIRRSFHAASPRCSSHVAAAVSRDSASVAVVSRPVHLPPLVLWKIRQSRGDVVVPLCLHRVASPLIDTRVRN